MIHLYVYTFIYVEIDVVDIGSVRRIVDKTSVTGVGSRYNNVCNYPDDESSSLRAWTTRVSNPL